MDSDLQKYISKRKKRDPEFAEDYEIGYEQFKLGVLLREARIKAGLTQEELARRMNTKKSAISRIENHAEDIKLSTLEKFAQAIGKTLRAHAVYYSPITICLLFSMGNRVAHATDWKKMYLMLLIYLTPLIYW